MLSKMKLIEAKMTRNIVAITVLLICLFNLKKYLSLCLLEIFVVNGPSEL